MRQLFQYPAAEIQSQIDSCYAEAYQALQRANVAHGICEDIAESVPVEKSYTDHRTNDMSDAVCAFMGTIVSRGHGKAGV